MVLNPQLFDANILALKCRCCNYRLSRVSAPAGASLGRGIAFGIVLDPQVPEFIRAKSARNARSRDCRFERVRGSSVRRPIQFRRYEFREGGVGHALAGPDLDIDRHRVLHLQVARTKLTSDTAE